MQGLLPWHELDRTAPAVRSIQNAARPAGATSDWKTFTRQISSMGCPSTTPLQGLPLLFLAPTFLFSLLKGRGPSRDLDRPRATVSFLVFRVLNCSFQTTIKHGRQICESHSFLWHIATFSLESLRNRFLCPGR